MEEINVYINTLWQSINFEFLIKFIIVYVFIIWISLFVWVWKDIRNRSSSIIFQVFCLIVAVIPFLGIFLYLLIRPSKTLYEKYYDEIESNLDIINEIIEERKKQFEKKINNSLKEEKAQVKTKNSKKNNYKYFIKVE
ncbi:hypothetical protein D8B46_01090, partial [Candidatus Gracilibacteria bacterium]